VSEPVPFAPPDITPSDEAAVLRVMRSGWLTTGDECLALEDELAAYLGVPHVVAVSSCTAAIEVAYARLGLPVGARLGVPTWTFASSALAPHHHGAQPVLLDVDPDTLNLSADSVAAALAPGAGGRPGLDAVVLVHFGGVPVDPAVRGLCAEAGVPVIEDCAHALGARDDRGMVGGQGTAGACLSFYATKNLTCGEGGALVTDDADLAAFARAFRLHGMSKDAWARYRPGQWAQYDLVGPGIKANLPDLLAALARSQLARFPELQQRRRQLVNRYRDRLAESCRRTGLRFLPGTLVEEGADHLVVVALPDGVDRTEVQGRLTSEGIATSVHFQPLHRFGWFGAHAEVGPSGVGVAEAMADRVLSLPLSPRLSDAQVDRVCATLDDALNCLADRRLPEPGTTP
jgi:dTDP-4-amino-4,6-dideoxygalactose transaminase